MKYTLSAYVEDIYTWTLEIHAKTDDEAISYAQRALIDFPKEVEGALYRNDTIHRDGKTIASFTWNEEQVLQTKHEETPK